MLDRTTLLCADMLSQSRRGKIIETNLSKLNVKKFDMEFEVDPLFSKTSAAFDEGGTGGLLLNHLRYVTPTLAANYSL